MLRLLVFILRVWDAFDVFGDSGKTMNIFVLKKDHDIIYNRSKGAMCE